MDPIVILQRVKDVPLYQCRICSYSCSLLQTYMDHILMHVSQTKVILSRAKFHSCDKCKCAFLSDKALKLHKADHVIKDVIKPPAKRRSKKKISCNCCGKKFESHFIKQHAEEMHADVPCSCRFCYLRFTTTELLVEHQNKTHYKISCDVCGKGLKTPGSLNKHLRLHDSNPRPYTCTVCGKKFTQPGSLNLHLKRHTGERNFDCKFCSKKFYNKSSLENHERIHTGHKPFICEHCNKAFSDPSALKRHVRIHTKEYRYFCTECPEKFTDASAMIRHKGKHSDKQDKKFKCDICEKCFNVKCNLDKHMLCHEGVKKFYCDYCGRNYLSKPYLYIHIRLMHLKSYECVYCGKFFETKRLCRSHKMKYHPYTFYCTTCPRTYRKESYFYAHKVVCSQRKSQKE